MQKFFTRILKANTRLRTLFSSTLWLLFLLPLSTGVLLDSISAQTFGVGKNTYTFDNIVRVAVTDNAGNTYVGGDFTSVSLWSGHGAKFSTDAFDNTTAQVVGGAINTVAASQLLWVVVGISAVVLQRLMVKRATA